MKSALVLLLGVCCRNIASSEDPSDLDNQQWADQRNARNGEIPYQARILYNNTLACGATILYPSYILTAKHCIKDLHEATVEAGSVRHGAQAIRRAVLRAEVFPSSPAERRRWLPEELFVNAADKKNRGPKGDIALLEVSPPFPTDIPDKLRPVPLRMSSANEGERCLLSGWSPLNKESAGSSEWLHMAEVDVFPRESEPCLREKPMADHVCTGRLGGGPNSCQGDSGGPVVCQNSRDKHWQLTAVVGKGRGCGESANLSKDMDVSLYTRWIEHVVGMDAARIGYYWPLVSSESVARRRPFW